MKIYVVIQDTQTASVEERKIPMLEYNIDLKHIMKDKVREIINILGL